VAGNTVVVRFLGNAAALNTVIGRVDQKLSGLGRLVGRLGIATGLAVAAATASSIKSFATFDEALRNSVATFSLTEKVSEESFQAMSDAARNVGLTTVISAQDAAAGLDFLAQAGFNTEQAIAALPQVAAFAAANMMDMATATELSTDAQVAFALDAEDSKENLENLVRVTDVLTLAQGQANQSTEQFAEAASLAGGMASTLGQSIESTLSVLGTLADNGQKGAAGATAVGISLRDLGNKSKKFAPVWKDLGIEVFNADESFRDITDILADFDRELGGLEPGELIVAMEKMGLTVKSNAVFFRLLGEAEEIAAKKAELVGAAGKDITLTKQEEQAQALIAQWNIFKGIVDDVAITIGAKFEPLIRRVLSFIGTWLVDNREMLEGKIDGFFQSITDWWFETGRGTLINIKDGFLFVFNTLRDWWNTYAPIIRERFNEVFDHMKTWWNETGQGLFDDLVNGLEEIKETAIRVFTAVKGWWESDGKAAFESIKETVVLVLTALSDWWAEFGDDILLFFEDVGEGARIAFEKITDWWDENGEDVLIGLAAVIVAIAITVGMVIRKFQQWKIVSNVVAIVLETFRLAIATVEFIIRVLVESVVILINIFVGLGTFIGTVLAIAFEILWHAIDILSEAIVLLIEGAITLGEELGEALLWIRDRGADAINGIRSGFNSLIGFLRGLPARIQRATFGLFGGISSAFVSAINFVIRAWNNLELRMPESRFLGPLSGASLSTPNIDEIGLAQGGVAQPNSPFLAILGDNRTQREVIAPEDMLRQVFSEEVGKTGGSGNSGVVVNIGELNMGDGDAQDVAEEIWWLARMGGQG
jgi:TP901 family phage tail tape measure protein